MVYMFLDRIRLIRRIGGLETGYSTIARLRWLIRRIGGLEKVSPLIEILLFPYPPYRRLRNYDVEAWGRNAAYPPYRRLRKAIPL